MIHPPPLDTQSLDDSSQKSTHASESIFKMTTTGFDFDRFRSATEAARPILDQKTLSTNLRDSSAIAPATSTISYQVEKDPSALQDVDIEKDGASASDDEKKGDDHSVRYLEDQDLEEVATELTPMEAFAHNVDGDQSPFPEVAACVPSTDDPSIQINREN